MVVYEKKEYTADFNAGGGCCYRHYYLCEGLFHCGKADSVIDFISCVLSDRGVLQNPSGCFDRQNAERQKAEEEAEQEQAQKEKEQAAGKTEGK